MRIRSLLLTGVILIFIACNKNDAPPNPPGQPPKTFTQCNCTHDSTEYIRAYFDDVYMCFNSSYNDTFSNVYYFHTSLNPNLDQLNMIRQNSDRSMSCQLYFLNCNLHNQALPYTIPHSNMALGEYAQITLLDFTQRWASVCQGCEDDDADYFALSWDGFSLTITDTTSGYVKGNFEGWIFTKTGRRADVDKGKFKIHVIGVG